MFNKLKKENYNKGYNQCLHDCIELLSDSIPQTMCPNTKDGYPLMFFAGTDYFVTCYGDNSEYRDKIYVVCRLMSLKFKNT